MRIVSILTIGLFLVSTGCAKAPQEKALTLVNAAAVDATMLECLRAFAERELHVPVRTLETPGLAGKESFQTLEKSAEKVKTDSDVVLIVLSGINGDGKHLAVYPEKGLALINAQVLYTEDSEKFARRLERQVMRAAAFSFGLTPTPDPFCVTRDYTSLEDLDHMGRNFSPPWQGRFAEEAENRGLFPAEAGGEKRSPQTP